MSSRDLPQEILRDILERLPVKTLIIFTSVCKSWYSMITDPDFIASHLSQSMLRWNGCLLHMPLSTGDQQISRLICDRTLEEHFKAFPFDCDEFFIAPAGSTNGVLCLTDAHSFGRIVYLCNPSIRKLKSLPDPTYMTGLITTWVVLGLGFDHVIGDHKIVRLSYLWDDVQNCRGQIANCIEVYTLRTNSWRMIEATVSCLAENSSTAFVNGSIHWTAWKRKGPEDLILSFDFSNEVFQELMLPATYCPDVEEHPLIVAGFHGSLSLLINGSPDDDGMFYCSYMWVMKEYGVAESWVKQFKLVVEEGIYRLPGLTTDGKIIYQNNKSEYFLGDPVDGGHVNTGFHGFSCNLYDFMESLVLIEEH